MTQKETNPYPFSDSNTRYQTFDYYMKHRFGGNARKFPWMQALRAPIWMAQSASAAVYTVQTGPQEPPAQAAFPGSMTKA